MSTPEAFFPSEEPQLRDGARLRSLARRLVADKHLAEDIVQDGLLKALGRVFRDTTHQERWLRRTLRNSAAESRRSAANVAVRERSAAREEAVPSPEDVALRLEAIELVVHSLRRLRDPYRSTITHLFIDELSPREVARREGVTVDVVHQHRHRGLELMRADLDRRTGGREAWLMPCLALARAPRASVLETLRSWTGVSPFAAATVAGILLSVGLVALLRAPGSSASSGWDSVPSSSDRTEARLAAPLRGGSQRAPVSDASLEVRVVRADTSQPVPAAQIAWSPLQDDPAAQERIREWLEQGRLEEETRANKNEFLAEEDGSAIVPLVRQGSLIVASHEGLWGFRLVRPGESGPVRVEVYPDDDQEVVVQDVDGRAVEGAWVSLSALGYYGVELVTDQTDVRGHAVLPHAGFAEESRRTRSPLRVGLQVAIPLVTKSCWSDIHREESPSVIQLNEQIAYADVRVVAADTHAPLPGRIAFDINGTKFSAVDGYVVVPIPVGKELTWDGGETRPQATATIPGEHITVVLECARRSERFGCARIRGRLLGPEGLPQAHRPIALHHAKTSEYQGLIAWANTDGTGAFELDSQCMELSKGCDLWLADDQGRQLVRLLADLELPSRGNTDLGNVVLPARARLASGRVVASDGTPVADARVLCLGDRAPNDEPVRSYERLETHTAVDGTFEFPTDHSESSQAKALLVTHPAFGPCRRDLSSLGTELVVELGPVRRFAGQVVLDPSVPHEMIWVEACFVESDLGWNEYHKERGQEPPASFVRSPIDASGNFELTGLGSGEYSLAIIYYSDEAFSYYWLMPPTLYEAKVSFDGDDPRAEGLKRIDVSTRFRCQRFDFIDSSGSPVNVGLEIRVNNDSFLKTIEPGIEQYSFVDGSASLLVPHGAQLLVSSRDYFPEVVDAWQGQCLRLERRPQLDFVTAGQLPALHEDFSLYLRVTAVDGSNPVDLYLDSEAPTASCLMPDRAGWRGTYVIRGSNDEEECGPALAVASGASASCILLSPPDAELVRFATERLWARKQE